MVYPRSFREKSYPIIPGIIRITPEDRQEMALLFPFFILGGVPEIMKR